MEKVEYKPVELCSQCGAPVKPFAERCEYCRSYFKISALDQIANLDDISIGQYVRHYRKLIDADPDNALVSYSLGICLLKLGMHAQAKEHFLKADELIPDNPDLCFYTAIAILDGKKPRFAKLNDIKDAEKKLAAALRIKPNDPRYLYLRGLIKRDFYGTYGLTEKPSSSYFFQKAEKAKISEKQKKEIQELVALKDEIIESDEERKKRKREERKKRTRIRIYFLPGYYWGIVAFFLIAGLLALMFDSGDSPLLSLIGLTAVAIGLPTISYWLYNRPSPSKMDKYFREDLEFIKNKRAVYKFGIDPLELVRENAIAYGPIIEGQGKQYVVSRKDKKARYRKIHFIVVGFGESQLFSYQGKFDISTGKYCNESTYEYFYRDVVSVTTELGKWEFKSNGKEQSADRTELFKLTTSAGTDITIPIRSEYLRSSGDKPIALATDTVLAIRKMLREKKEGQAI